MPPELGNGKLVAVKENPIAAYSGIREEELKNRVAAEYFGKYDCGRIPGNIDFCVSPKRRDPRQMTFITDAPILWAEAKNHPTDVHRMLAQLILTIKGELKGNVEPPRFVGCFDNEKIAFVEYHYILPVFNLNDFNWTQTPSSVDDKTVETVRGVVPAEKIVVFSFGADDAEIKSFVARNFASGESPALATPIDRNNFTFIYQKWRAEVMPHIDAPWDVLKKKYALYDRDFFLAEMNVDDNGTPEVVDDRPAEDFYITFDVNDKKPYCIHRKNEDEFDITMSFGFKPDGLAAYSAFWRRYKRPPKREYWDFIVSRLDLLVPQDVRERKGSFFTPAIWVEKSQLYIAAVLGENWQDEYDVWDCAGGTANMEVGLTNKYRIWVSTVDQQDVDVIRERIRNGANLLDSHVFRFDFLNDSFDKLPEDLRDVINDPEKRKRLVIYINPPYVEASNAQTTHGTPGENRVGVSVSSIRAQYLAEMGRAVNELFAQFLIRIATEIPGCIIGQFSKLKHLQGPNFNMFRRAFHGTLEKCFIVPADTFDNVKGQFPIGFFVWRLGGGVFTSAVADVYDRQGVFIGTKSIYSPDGQHVLTDWIRQFYDKVGEYLAYCRYLGSDFQHNNGVFITLSPSASDLKQVKGNWITPKNVMAFAIYFAVRLCIDADWLNDRDQFLYPNDGWKNDAEFQADCLVFTLLSGQNRVSSADGVNHWIPFTEEEVGAKSCFKSHFMSDFINGRAGSTLSAEPPLTTKIEYATLLTSPRFRDSAGVSPENPVRMTSAHFFMSSMQPTAARPESAPYQSEFDLDTSPNLQGSKTLNNERNASSRSPNPVNPVNFVKKENLSSAARAVLEAGRELWRYYHAQPNANPNASYYDIRLHFQGVKRTVSGKEQMNATSSDATYNALLANLRAAHKTLAAQIAPKVYEYGFLKR